MSAKSGPATETSTYTYDAAGRLVTAVIPRHTLTYGFAATGGCGVNPAAGRNGHGVRNQKRQTKIAAGL